MSYGKELETEITIERELVYARAVSMAENGIWETKDGQKLNVRDMTDSHIANCLAMLKRGGSPYADPFILMFEAEKKGGEKNRNKKPYRRIHRRRVQDSAIRTMGRLSRGARENGVGLRKETC